MARFAGYSEMEIEGIILAYWLLHRYSCREFMEAVNRLQRIADRYERVRENGLDR
jgi:hypothetical protein